MNSEALAKVGAAPPRGAADAIPVDVATIRRRRGRPSRAATCWVTGRLPIGLVRVVDAECERLGIDRRSFLMLLHSRMTGEMPRKRPPGGVPAYRLSVDDAKTLVPYRWPVTNAQRDSINYQRGFLSISQYLIEIICDWLGIRVSQLIPEALSAISNTNDGRHDVES
jgi:hypothetical protein